MKDKGGWVGVRKDQKHKKWFFLATSASKKHWGGDPRVAMVMFLGELFSIAWWLFHPICCQDWIYVACSEKGMLRAGGRALSKITKVGRSPLALDFKVHTFFDKWHISDNFAILSQSCIYCPDFRLGYSFRLEIAWSWLPRTMTRT